MCFAEAARARRNNLSASADFCSWARTTPSRLRASASLGDSASTELRRLSASGRSPWLSALTAFAKRLRLMSPLLPVCPRTGKTATSKTSSTAVFVSLVTRPGAVRHWRGFSEVVIEQCIPFTPQSFCKCWFSFNRRHALGPKDRKLVAPVREDGDSIFYSPKGPKGRHKSWRTFGAQVTDGHISPSSRTGLLTSGPSDLRVQTAPVPASRVLVQFE